MLNFHILPMKSTQPGILAEIPPLARYLTFSIEQVDALPGSLQDLRNVTDGDSLVVGIGQSLADALGHPINGLHSFPVLSTKGLDIPSTPAALWCWLRGDDRGQLYHQSRLLESLLAPAFALVDCVDAFTYEGNRDLSGYEDGTENPSGEQAIACATVSGVGSGMDGSSFVAVQQWLHDFDSFDAMSSEQQDDVIGRHIADNEEFDEAPDSAHVKRSAQESFQPEAFILRRSMPWAADTQSGLMFVAYGQAFAAFEAILNRMAGLEDGIQDGLFGFTRPLTGSYFWCPPMQDGELDLSALGL